MSVPTRGVRGRSYTLLTPENHYVSRLPNLPGAELIKLVTPRLAPSRIAQTLVRLPQAGISAEIPGDFETFLFGLTGAVTVSWSGEAVGLGPRAFAYLPAGLDFTVRSPGAGELLWIKRRYEPWPGLRDPPPAHGQADALGAIATTTPGLQRRELLDPDDPRRDFTMSLMTFDPGAGLTQIEIHDEEHGLYMTAGSGLYTLERDAHAVAAHDFIYMAPYCPQGFTAGPEGAEYLLYKDIYRDGF